MLEIVEYKWYKLQLKFLRELFVENWSKFFVNTNSPYSSSSSDIAIACSLDIVFSSILWFLASFFVFKLTSESESESFILFPCKSDLFLFVLNVKHERLSIIAGDDKQSFLV